MIYSLLAFVKKFVLFSRWSICKCLFFKTWKDVSSVLSANPIWRIVVPIRFFCLRRNKASISFHLCEMHLNRKMSSIETRSDIIFCPLNEYNATRLSLSGTSLYWDKIAIGYNFAYQIICKSRYLHYLSIFIVANKLNRMTIGTYFSIT